MQTATVDGKQVKVGDHVSFKSDYEQAGQITKIERDRMGNVTLTLENENGFGGEYLRYATTTTVWASDCWLD